MVECTHCGGQILFGGIRDGRFIFCNKKCYKKGYANIIAREIPVDILTEQAQEVASNPCPLCLADEPVTAHMVHWIFSLVFFTFYKSYPVICCESCAHKTRMKYILLALVLGWWHFPSGIIMTPVQIYRNIRAMFRPMDENMASRELKQYVRMDLANRFIADQGGVEYVMKDI
jgi:hypothetical protein